EIQKALGEGKSLYPCLELSTSIAHGAPVVEILQHQLYYTINPQVILHLNFQALFSFKCVGCGFHLKEETENVFLPPCWRTFEDLSPYHYQCRP
ncbi:hypothetical protein pdam_00018117, partial [Pocillopora damicornis]